jgi:tetratricopeptide (TPR) repeat protein
MAKNNKVNEAQVAEDEVIYEDESGEESGSSSGGAAGLLKNRNFLIGAGAVVLLGVAGFFFFRSQNPTPDTEAEMAMRPAIAAFQSDSLVAAINGRPTANNTMGFTGFSDLVSDYSGTPQGNHSKLFLGMAYLQTGNIEDAIDQLEGYKKGSDMAAASAYAGLGSAYEEKAEFEKAAGYFEKAARTPGENSQTTPFYLMQAARNYESAGDNASALKLYRNVYSKYPNSEEAQTAIRYIGKLDEANEL